MYTKAKKIYHSRCCVLNEGATFSAERTVVESKASDNLEGQLYLFFFFFSSIVYKILQVLIYYCITGHICSQRQNTEI